MAIASVGARGSNVAGAGNNQSIALSPSSNTTVGNIVVVFVTKKGTTALTGVADSKSNAWSKLGSYQNTTSDELVECWMAQITTAILTTDSITATWGVNETDICISAHFSIPQTIISPRDDILMRAPIQAAISPTMPSLHRQQKRQSSI